MDKDRFIFLFIVFVNVICLSQEDKTKDLQLLYKKVSGLCEEERNTSFCKAFFFFKDKKYDSCYAYSSKALLLGSVNNNQKNVLNYIQGTSAIRKKIYKKALSSILLVSDSGIYKSLKYEKLGRIYLGLKKYDKAIFHYEKFIKSDTDLVERIKRNIFHNLGICYIHKKEYQKAKEYFHKKNSLIKKKDTFSIISAKMELANVYYEQYLDKQAIPLFKEAYDLAKVFSNIELKQNTTLNMAVVEENRKHYKESVAYYKEHDKWKDSIWSRDRIWELTEKDKEIAVAQKQEEIAVQNLEIKHQKEVQKELLFGAACLLSFLGVLAFFYRKLRTNNKLITEQKEALTLANKTKDYLFSVVSHDLRSPINMIKRQHKKLAKHIENNDLPAIKEATKSAIAVTESTSHLLNNVLHWSLEQSNMLNFTQEEQVLQPIIEHVLYDYEDLVTVKTIAISSDLESGILVLTDKESLKIVLRNLIDNSMKYMKDSGSIAVKTVKHSESQVCIEIKDTGIGMSEGKLKEINALKDLSMDKIDRSKGVGLGLLLCQTLIKKNNGSLFFESEEGISTTAIILLPLA